MAFAAIVGLAAGMIAAARPNSWVDHVTMVLATVSLATPAFWFALLLILVFAAELRWLPMLGAGRLDAPGDLLIHLVLPACAIGARHSALVARLTRSGVLGILGQDYVRTARAKGLNERTVVIRHVLRNVLIPIVTVVGTQLAVLLGGAVVIETVFGRPGIGRLLVQAIANRDYPLVQGTILVFSFMIVIVNLVVDLSYGLIDPRVRHR
jgi:ABC-type dipeptide/oligopeptide/nickel transport system permease component